MGRVTSTSTVRVTVTPLLFTLPRTHSSRCESVATVWRVGGLVSSLRLGLGSRVTVRGCNCSTGPRQTHHSSSYRIVVAIAMSRDLITVT